MSDSASDLNPNLVILDYYLNSKEKNAANGIDNILRDKTSEIKILPVIMLSSQKIRNSLPDHHVRRRSFT